MQISVKYEYICNNFDTEKLTWIVVWKTKGIFFRLKYVKNWLDSKRHDYILSMYVCVH